MFAPLAPMTNGLSVENLSPDGNPVSGRFTDKNFDGRVAVKLKHIGCIYRLAVLDFTNESGFLPR